MMTLAGCVVARRNFSIVLVCRCGIYEQTGSTVNGGTFCAGMLWSSIQVRSIGLFWIGTFQLRKGGGSSEMSGFRRVFVFFERCHGNVNLPTPQVFGIFGPGASVPDGQPGTVLKSRFDLPAPKGASCLNRIDFVAGHDAKSPRISSFPRRSAPFAG